MGRSDEGAWQPGLENLSAPRQRMPEGHPRQDDIRDWLIAQVANRLQGARSEIDPREPFTAFGMDSAAAVGLSGDLQDWLGLQLSPTLLWEHPSIEALSAYLATRLTAGEMESAGATESRWMQPTREPIAIVGIGCRLPGAPNPRALWRLLRAGGDAITEVPTDRWDMRAVYDPAPATPGKMTSRWGGFLDQVDQFDAAFFGIAPREASAMDPQQRLLLEVTWEALEDAGLVPGRLAGAAVGVFVGISSNDYGQMQMSDVQHISAYSGTGSALSIAANRISYVLDVRGPSVAIDTACSSSLVAVHQACHSLWSGESALAVAGGVNIILSPAVTVNFSQAGVLSPDGHCKAFDARADGYVRGEGAGAIVLKPLSRALRDGDPIYAVIRGSAVNHDGRSNGLMAPNPHAQEDLLREAYRQAGVSPGQVNYVEAQALGVLLGDSIEARALGVVMSVDRPAGSHCMIGSIKTNIGHLEAASGIAGLIKVALSLVHGELPASLHFQEPNPHIPFADLPLRVQRETGPWPAHTGPALAGVSAFGFGGTNAHIVLEEAPARPVLASPGDTSDQRQAYLLPLSARDPHALSMLAQAYHSYLVSDAGTATSLRDLCYTASVRRGHADHRLSVVAHSRDVLAQSLAAISRGETWPGASVGRALPGRRPKVAFVFPGQGIEWIGMARDLVERELPFRGMLAQCEQAFREYVDWSLFDVLAADESTSRPRQPDVASPILFAIEVALAAVWRAWGIEPDAVVGHGTGEVAAAFVAGAISLADAARIICRGSQRASHDELVALFAGIAPHASSVPIYSTVTGVIIQGQDLDAAYWARTLRVPVLFADAVQRLAASHHEVFLELSPHPTLLGAIEHELQRAGYAGHALPSLRRQDDARGAMLESLGALYVLGIEPAWTKLYPAGGQHVHLPTYPWQRQRHWLPEPSPASSGGRRSATPTTPERTVLGDHSTLATHPGTHFWEMDLGRDLLSLRGEHAAPDTIGHPATTIRELVMEAASEAFGSGPHTLEQVSVVEPLLLAPDGARRAQLVIEMEDPERALFRFFSLRSGQSKRRASWTLHAIGTIRVRLAHQQPETHETLRELSALAPTAERTAGATTARERLLALAPDERGPWLEAYLDERIASALGFAPNGETRIDTLQRLGDLGLDSLMAVELKNHIERDLQITVPLMDLLQDANIARLVTWIGDSLAANAAATEPLPSDPLPASDAAEYPLSHGQRALWFLHQLAPQSAAYNVASAVRMHGKLDIAALRRAFQSLVDRHPALRTTFVARDDEPVQRVYDHADVAFEVVDARGWVESALETRLADEVHRPFDLAHGPLLRAAAFVRSAEECVLAVTVHHIVTDLWSLGLIMADLRVLYRAERAGSVAPPLPVSLTYADYVRWQQAMLAGEHGERLQTYWTRALAGAPPVLDLPTDHPRPPIQTYRGFTHAFTLDHELTQQLRALARREGTTLYTVLLAAFQTLLYRYSGQEDLLVGSTAAGRTRAELERLVGYVANPLVLRADLSGDPTFRDVLGRTRRTVLEALDHQDYPFPLLVERLQPARDPSRSPLFQAMFVFDSAHLYSGLPGFFPDHVGRRVDWEDLVIEPVQVERNASQFDLTLMLVDADGALSGSLEANAELFDPGTIARMAEHLRVLLTGLAADPEQRVATAPLLTDAERQQLLVEWNATDAEYPSGACVHHLFEAQVKRTPNAVAVICGPERLTYRELNQRANWLAQRLQAQGVGPEVRVGLCMERSPEMVIGVLAVLKAGGAYVPLDPTYPRERLAFMLRDASPRVLLTQRRLRQRLPGGKVPVVYVDVAGTSQPGTQARNVVSDVRPENLAYVIYTSGSTGRPKGVMIPHRGVVNYLSWATKAYAVAEGRGAPVPSSLAFDLTVTSLFSPLLVGRPVMMLSDERGVDALTETVRAERDLSLVKITPAHLELLARTVPADEASGKVRAFIIGGEALSFETLAFWRTHAPGTRLINEYGPTETVVGCCVYDAPPDAPHSGPVPIGRPIANTRLYVLDAHLQPVPIGVTGELFIGGAGVARGYLNRPELTAERFVAHPFSDDATARLYRTGDLVRYLPDGNLEFLGRVDDQVKLRGYRIELGEIEATLTQHPDVGEAVVLVREDGDNGKRLVAYVVPRAGATLTTSSLRAYVERRLPDYMVPSFIMSLDALPLTHHGKVDRRALPAPDWAEHRARAAAYVAPRTALEAEVAAVWAAVLGTDRVGVDDQFFALGGHSLLAAQLVLRLRERFGVELPLASLFATPTVAGIARVIEAERAAGVPVASAGAPSIDLAAEAVLDPSIVPEAPPSEDSAVPRRILLTGATGFLGTYLLAELLEQTNAAIYCLVRDATADGSAEMLHARLHARGLWKNTYRGRVIPLGGDLAQPRLGLAPEQFLRLAADLDAIWHNGALVNFAYPYQLLKASNVLGTQELLRLACAVRAKPFHYVSTLSVFSSSGASVDRPIGEHDPIDDHHRGHFTGYEQSKWVAERLVTIARSRGLPVCIFRPGTITGHSQTGDVNLTDYLWLQIKSCLQLGAMPDTPAPLHMTPVDFVSRAMVALALQPASRGNAFHLTNPSSITMPRLARWLRSIGYRVRSVSFDAWRARLMRDFERSTENALYPLAPLMTEGDGAEQRFLLSLRFDSRATFDALRDMAIACPPVDDTLLHTYVAYLQRVGFIDAPQDGSADAPEERSLAAAPCLAGGYHGDD